MMDEFDTLAGGLEQNLIPTEPTPATGVGYSRAVSDVFMKNLRLGMLFPFLARVREDDTLMLALRGSSINIYYRGGNLFRIVAVSEATDDPAEAVYRVEFDQKYNAGHPPLAVSFPIEIRSREAADSVIREAPFLKYVMDRFFATKSKSEREFQQLVVRENNRSAISHQTDYFIVDIEIAGILPGARYDMLAVRWLDSQRGRTGILVPALIEMKHGDTSIDGSSGMAKHLDDVCALIDNTAAWSGVLSGLQTQLLQLHQLGLLRFNESSKQVPLKIDKNSKPEFIFILANYNPRGTILQRLLSQVNQSKINHPGFDLLFFVSCFAGYGMHRESMLSFDEFRREVTKLHDLAQRKPH